MEWVMNGAVLFIALHIRKQSSGPEAPQLVELINSVSKPTLLSPSTTNMAHTALDRQDLAWEYHQKLGTTILKFGLNKSFLILLVF